MDKEQRTDNPMATIAAADASNASPATASPATAPTDHTTDRPVDRSPSELAPEKPTPKTGAPALNTNRQRAGLHSHPDVVAMRFALGTLAGDYKRVENDVYQFRQLLEATVIDARGSIGLVDAALIQTACRHERHARLAQAWLKKHEATMTHAERLAYSKAIADSSTARDKTLERLKLDGEAGAFNPADLYRTPSPALLPSDTRDGGGTDSNQAAEPASASNAAVGDGVQ